jgi:hypothetical protein
LHVPGRGARTDACGRSFAVLSAHVSTAGFEPQHASPFLKRAKEPPPLQKNTRRSRLSLNNDRYLCASPYTIGGVSDLYQR